MKNTMKTKYYSYKSGKLSKGCQLCVKGKKSVLFITGVCPRNCFYCPISEKKKNKNVIYINELKTSNFDKIIEEIELCSSKGVSITGGDPLSKLRRTCYFIRELKKHFGKQFHIHLYTSLTLVTEKNLKKLYNSGLDEIRFHIDIENEVFLDKVILFKKFKWKIGMEIPVIPGFEKKTKKIIKFVKNKVDFINLNELEYSDNEDYDRMGFHVKNNLSYAIKGSLEAGKRLLKYCEKEKIRCHLCTAKLKDSVQLKNRINLRLKNIKKWYDTVLDEGILMRGAIYLKKPEFDYEIKTKKINFSKLNQVKSSLKFKTEIDLKKKRLLTSINNIIKYSEDVKSLNLIPTIVKEYATSDQFNLEIDFI